MSESHNWLTAYILLKEFQTYAVNTQHVVKLKQRITSVCESTTTAIFYINSLKLELLTVHRVLGKKGFAFSKIPAGLQ